ncbi:MAG TPA: hypothetical protein VMU87_17395 [Stellaceae bacterium]|nr:hypothetical protein [Stellaceae bacterium]
MDQGLFAGFAAGNGAMNLEGWANGSPLAALPTNSHVIPDGHATCLAWAFVPEYSMPISGVTAHITPPP